MKPPLLLAFGLLLAGCTLAPAGYGPVAPATGLEA